MSRHPIKAPNGTGTPLLAQVVARPESVQPVYQPIVELSGGVVVGFEALSRWPTVGPVDPVSVFDHARARGELGAVEWACRLAALEGAVDAGLGSGQALFVNVESDALDPVRMPAPPHAAAIFDAAAAAGIQLVVELTERTLLTDPAMVLATVDTARSFGHAIALDDVGANDDSLTLLPLIAPDIVKLDRSLIQNEMDERSASILTALAAHTERTDTMVLAEGIETTAHLDTALGWGATLGQGLLFGSPGALPTHPTASPAPLFFGRHRPGTPVTPGELLTRLDTRIADETLLQRISRHLEDHAMTIGDPLAILTTFESAAQFTPVVAQRYRALAEQHPLVAALGVGIDDEPALGVRSAAITTDHPLAREWVLTIVGHHYCLALIAREISDPPARSAYENSSVHIGGRAGEGRRRFEYALTHERVHTIAAARSLIRSITPRNQW